LKQKILGLGDLHHVERRGDVVRCLGRDDVVIKVVVHVCQNAALWCGARNPGEGVFEVAMCWMWRAAERINDPDIEVFQRRRMG